MLLCTWTRNESVSHLVEWIEFHRLQGFDHVRFYDSTKEGDVYGPLAGELQTVYGANLSAAGISVAEEFDHKQDGQAGALEKCNQWADPAITGLPEHAGAKPKFDWMAVHDVDEFHYSPLHVTTKDFAAYIATNLPNTSQVHTHQFRYGPKGVRKPVELPGLVIEQQLWRAPAIQLGEAMVDEAVVHGPLRQVCNQCSPFNRNLSTGHWKNASKLAEFCEPKQKSVAHKPPFKRDHFACEYFGCELKSMWRLGRGWVSWIHFANKCRGDVTYAHPSHLRGNHYYLRSVQEGLAKHGIWGGQLGRGGHAAAASRGVMTLYKGSTQFFESVYDATILQWVPALQRRVERLYQAKRARDGGTGTGHIMYERGIGDIAVQASSGDDNANRRALRSRVEARMELVGAKLRTYAQRWWAEEQPFCATKDC